MNSLVGMDSMADTISQPKIPEEVPAWSTIERLNKERDLVGIYLSAHPLDEYRIILEDVCSVHLGDMQEVLDKKEERDVTLGGVVTATRSGFTKNNKPFGITKLEDFSGTYEIALFGDDWMRFSNFMKEGYFLYIKGRVVPRKYGPEIYELKVGTIDLLPNIKDTLLQSITIQIQLEELDEEVVNDLHTMLREHEGKTEVFFSIKDGEGQFRADLKSRSLKISVQKELINYIKKHEGLDYKIN
jgi:DNA polymerase-3 subunit alpha